MYQMIYLPLRGVQNLYIYASSAPISYLVGTISGSSTGTKPRLLIQMAYLIFDWKPIYSGYLDN